MGTRRRKLSKHAVTRKKSRTKKPTVHKVCGYTILLLRIPTDNVYVSSMVNNGFVSETKSTAGINHLLEHMIANAWSGCGKDTCTVFWNKNGIKSNASTDMTVLKYYTYGRKDDTATMLKYIIDIMKAPVFTNDSLYRQKRAVLNELLMYANNPENELTDVFNKAFFSIDGLKYASDYTLQIRNLKDITLSKLRKGFEDNYRSNNIVFSVTGNFDEKDVLREFKRLLSCTKSGNGAVESFCRNCYTRNHSIIYLPNKTSKTTKIIIGFPSTLRIQDKEFLCVDLGLQILSNIAFEVLRADKKLVYGVSLKPTTISCGTIVMVSIYVDDENAKKVLEAIFKLLQKYCHSLIPKQYLSSAQKESRIRYDDTMPTPSLVGRVYANQYIVQQGVSKPIIKSLSEYNDYIQNTTREDIRRMYRRVFTFKDCLCAYQGKSKLKVDWSDLL